MSDWRYEGAKTLAMVMVLLFASGVMVRDERTKDDIALAATIVLLAFCAWVLFIL